MTSVFTKCRNGKFSVLASISGTSSCLWNVYHHSLWTMVSVTSSNDQKSVFVLLARDGRQNLDVYVSKVSVNYWHLFVTALDAYTWTPLACCLQDDLRKDARLMEFNAIVNRFLYRDAESRRRQLHIRTYVTISLKHVSCPSPWWCSMSESYMRNKLLNAAVKLLLYFLLLHHSTLDDFYELESSQNEMFGWNDRG